MSNVINVTTGLTIFVIHFQCTDEKREPQKYIYKNKDFILLEGAQGTVLRRTVKITRL